MRQSICGQPGPTSRAVPIERHDNSAVLFADISGSTPLFGAVGNDRGREIVARTLDAWSALAVASGGHVVQLRGDGMLCTFPSVDAALAAVIGMRDLPYEPPLSMHAGLHAGAILRDDEQLYGDVVNVAARMADIAKRFEIVLTPAAHAQLSDPGHWPHLRLIRQVPVKGKPLPMDIYLLPNAKHIVTDYRPPLRTKSVFARLVLRYGGQTYAVDVDSGACLIGRDDDCRLRIAHRLVSRRHASVECVSGKFFLQDHSTNGTYVIDGDQAPVLVQRELYQLKGRGAISLGLEPKENVGETIFFTVGG
jgi:class 3 adenylate cyclase